MTKLEVDHFNFILKHRLIDLADNYCETDDLHWIAAAKAVCEEIQRIHDLELEEEPEDEIIE